MDGLASEEVRIVLLGKTGDGKSSSANTIFGEELFTCNSSPNPETQKCEAKVKTIDGNIITLVDTPGFFDPDRSDEELNPAIAKCITECAPGPHAFVIVLSVGRYSKQEMEVVQKITESFGEGVLKYATVLFTHGDDLNECQTIEEFVEQSPKLKELVEKCGGGCHVIDNKHWKLNQQDEYRSNRVQVKKLLNTIEEMVRKNSGCYTNKMLEAVKEELQAEYEIIRKETNGKLSEEKMREEAKKRVSKTLIKLAGGATGALLGAFIGIAASTVIAIALYLAVRRILAKATAGATEAGAVGAAVEAGAAGAGATIGVGGGVGKAVDVVLGLSALAGAGATIVVGGGVGLGLSALAGAVGGGIVGAEAAEGAETAFEAAKKATTANYGNVMAAWKHFDEFAAEVMNSKLLKLISTKFQ